ncbi:triose-phosphate isomerase [Cryomorphaceae bacterium 1068]|nr:triose-phosphate isomerase [Cryomorphaceae bacterium 1068]
MRKPLVAGNWKMNKNHADAKALLQALVDRSSEIPSGVDVMVAPPSLYLSEMAAHANDAVAIGSQDVSTQEEDGAFTGEFSAVMLQSAGVRYAIVGHSERREYHGETDEEIREKIAACVAAGIRPVYCCGEKLEERESGQHVSVVSHQVKTALEGFSASELKDLVVAYEPVWAIGTGKTASSEQAQEMHAEIRNVLGELFNSDFANSIRILYGGSAKPANAAELFAQPDVDGGLIGGASLKADDFLKVVEAAG